MLRCGNPLKLGYILSENNRELWFNKQTNWSLSLLLFFINNAPPSPPSPCRTDPSRPQWELVGQKWEGAQWRRSVQTSFVVVVVVVVVIVLIVCGGVFVSSCPSLCGSVVDYHTYLLFLSYSHLLFPSTQSLSVFSHSLWSFSLLLPNSRRWVPRASAKGGGRLAGGAHVTRECHSRLREANGEAVRGAEHTRRGGWTKGKQLGWSWKCMSG